MVYLTLHDSKVPLLGFGTFRIGAESALRVVAQALEVGYRHIDTAQMYGNEAEIGQVIRRASIPRAEIFITTNIWPSHFTRTQLGPSVDESLARLGTDYVDLLLLYWRNPQAAPLSEALSMP